MIETVWYGRIALYGWFNVYKHKNEDFVSYGSCCKTRELASAVGRTALYRIRVKEKAR